MSEGEKKYEPTLRRREKARLEGKFAYSPDLMGAISLAVGLTGTLICAASVVEWIKKLFLNSIAISGSTAGPAASAANRLSHVPTPEELFQSSWTILGQMFTLFLPFLGLLALASLAAHFSQRRFLFASDREWVNTQNVNPAQGFLRLFEAQNVVRQIVNLVKASLIFGFVWLFFRNQFESILQLPYGELNAAILRSGALIQSVLIRLAGLLLAVGIADYFWQYRRFEKSLWMSEQEMRDEQKDA